MTAGGMQTGRLIAVVGPSGVGKDSIMAQIVAAMPQIRRVRRTITRAAELGGEDYAPLTPAAFRQAAAEGAFCLHWDAHGLLYGIPQKVQDDLQNGSDCIANLSRAALPEAARLFPKLVVLHITASPARLAQRLQMRGRENMQDIESRLAGAHKPLPEGLNIIEICNDGPLDQAVAQALAALQPVRG